MGDTDFKVAGTRDAITALQVCMQKSKREFLGQIFDTLG